jgi:hypothetical protein
MSLAGRPQGGTPGVVAAAVAHVDEGTHRVTSIELVSGDGDTFALDTATLDLLVDPFEPVSGVEDAPVPSYTEQSLSPTGRYLAFASAKGIVVDDVERDGWDFVEVPESTPELMVAFRWQGDHTVVVGDQQVDVRSGAVRPYSVDHGGASGTFPVSSPWGPAFPSPDDNRVAQGWFSDEVTAVHAGITNPEVVAVDGRSPALLAMAGTERRKGCCAVAGWLDDDRVVYKSRTDDEVRLLVWDTRTGDVSRLTTLRGLDGRSVASIAVGQSTS